jgi:hypothetical protein
VVQELIHRGAAHDNQGVSKTPSRRRGRIGALFDLISLAALTFALPPLGLVVAARCGVREARAGRPAAARLFCAFAALSALTTLGLYAALRGNHSLALLCETVATVAFVGLALRSLLNGTFRLLSGLRGARR